MGEKRKIAWLVYYDEWDGEDLRSFVVRYTSPVVEGRFTSRAWFSMPAETSETAQEVANRAEEVVFYENEGKYYFPEPNRR